jgi:uncharacterized protein with PQ loop repeat
MIALSLEAQEYFGWAGNFIFISAQLFQIAHTFKIKKTKDIAYGLQIMFIIGNIMFTTFGILDESLSMFIGNGTSLLLSLVQLTQKIYYDNYFNGYYPLPALDTPNLHEFANIQDPGEL